MRPDGFKIRTSMDQARTDAENTQGGDERKEGWREEDRIHAQEWEIPRQAGERLRQPQSQMNGRLRMDGQVGRNKRERVREREREEREGKRKVKRDETEPETPQRRMHRTRREIRAFNHSIPPGPDVSVGRKDTTGGKLQRTRLALDRFSFSAFCSILFLVRPSLPGRVSF